MEAKNTLKKEIKVKGNKKMYLLGTNEEGKKLWLIEAEWQCHWYWGFGYVQSFSRGDIETHNHIDSSFMGVHEVWDTNKMEFVKTDYIHNIYDCPRLVETTFTKEEGWQLSELFTQFYKFKEVARILHNGCAGLTTLLDYLKVEYPNREEHLKDINENILPQIFDKVYTILSPQKEE